MNVSPATDDTGRGTVILVPGLLCDGTVWEHQVAALSPSCEVVVADLTRHDSIPAMAADILANGPARFSIAGHSMGARVALAVYEQAPRRVERLALLDTGVHPASASEPETRQRLLDISARSGMRALADAWLPRMVKPGLLDADRVLRNRLYAMVEGMTPQVHRAQIAALLNRPDAHPLLGSITCPVLVGVGALDGWSTPEQHEAMAAAIPNARYTVFADSGHMAPMEAADAVSEALLQWMREPAGV